jgi:hypothetical protein
MGRWAGFGTACEPACGRGSTSRSLLGTMSSTLRLGRFGIQSSSFGRVGLRLRWDRPGTLTGYATMPSSSPGAVKK